MSKGSNFLTVNLIHFFGQHQSWVYVFIQQILMSHQERFIRSFSPFLLWASFAIKKVKKKKKEAALVVAGWLSSSFSWGLWAKRSQEKGKEPNFQEPRARYSHWISLIKRNRGLWARAKAPLWAVRILLVTKKSGK